LRFAGATDAEEAALVCYVIIDRASLRPSKSSSLKGIYSFADA